MSQYNDELFYIWCCFIWGQTMHLCSDSRQHVGCLTLTMTLALPRRYWPWERKEWIPNQWVHHHCCWTFWSSRLDGGRPHFLQTPWSPCIMSIMSVVSQLIFFGECQYMLFSPGCHLAHCCTIFLCHPGLESIQEWQRSFRWAWCDHIDLFAIFWCELLVLSSSCCGVISRSFRVGLLKWWCP